MNSLPTQTEKFTYASASDNCSLFLKLFDCKTYSVNR